MNDNFHPTIEEWPFFVIVPYASMFIYEVSTAYWGKMIYSPRISLIITLLAGIHPSG
jgi:hypothetical protein